MLRVLALAAIAASCASAAAPPPRKSLAGPPSEFAAMRLPTPLKGALATESFVSDVFFTQVSGEGDGPGAPSEFAFHQKVVVDSKTAFSLTTLVPVPEGGVLTAELVSPSGSKLDLAQHVRESTVPIGNLHVPATTYLFTTSIETGVYELTLLLRTAAGTDAATLAKLSNPNSPVAHGRTLLWNQSPTVMHAHINTYSLVTNEDVGIVARLADSATLLEGQAPNAITGAQISARIDVTLPDGKTSVVVMHDDGLHGDLEANDGVFAGSMRAAEVGLYSMTAILEGTLPDGTTPFRRSTEHLVPVSSLEVVLDGTASATWTAKANETRRSSRAVGAPNTEEVLDLFVGVKPRAEYQRVDRKFRAYAEVWGTSPSGESTPVAWVSSMVNVVEAPAGAQQSMGFHLALDSGWIAAATAAAPFTLKNVALQDSMNYVPETEAASIPVQLDQATSLRAVAHSRRALTLEDAHLEWRVGRNPLPPFSAANAVAKPSKSGLVLLHGYCSETNPFEPKKADFGDDSYYFLNAKASISNDEFALKVVDFIENNDLESFGLIGHSQGGLVSTHLLNYYFTGLDNAAPGELIQSIGSPYQGCSAAGSIANLGQVFGVGCGENLDLSKDASALWAAGIAPETKKNVYYYTTTYKLGNFFGDWCSLPMNAILSYPNDGTSELKYTAFEGANDMGNTEKQCHTTGMGYEPQYWDDNRNKKMSKNAAR